MLSTHASENGSYVVTFAFTDENDVAVLPDSITWTLTKENGEIVNDREDVAVAVPASSVSIALTGDDLALATTGDTQKRIVSVTAPYTSGDYGALTLTGSESFEIDKLVEA